MLARSEKPVTIERLEQGLDKLAELIVELGPDGHQCLCLYQWFEEELQNFRRRQDDMSVIMERAKRSKNRRAAQPC